MFSKTMLITAASAIPIENKNDQPEHAYFTGTSDPGKLKEVCKEGQTFEVIQETVTNQRDEKNSNDSRVTDAKKLLIKAKDTENDQRSCPSVTTQDNATVTTNNEPTPPNDDLDMYAPQTGISDVYTAISRNVVVKKVYATKLKGSMARKY